MRAARTKRITPAMRPDFCGGVRAGAGVSVAVAVTIRAVGDGVG
jgi:hypothetical protein